MKLEEAIARSLLQQDFTPTEDIRSLMLSAREYIEREIQKENESIRYVDSMETSQWGDAKYHLYNRAIVQRLWLMQIDILTL